MKKRTYHYYADPSHGWLKVPFKDIVNLGLTDKISSFSYHKGDFVYLEEDCDLTAFILVHGENWKEKLNIKEHIGNKRSKIRNYPRYSKGN